VRRVERRKDERLKKRKEEKREQSTAERGDDKSAKKTREVMSDEKMSETAVLKVETKEKIVESDERVMKRNEGKKEQSKNSKREEKKSDKMREVRIVSGEMAEKAKMKLDTVGKMVEIPEVGPAVRGQHGARDLCNNHGDLRVRSTGVAARRNNCQECQSKCWSGFGMG
jgi:hypothetical protein